MTMKKFINDPSDLAKELLEGFSFAYNDKVNLVSEKLIVRANPKIKSKVAIITLGGAGHEPASCGFVGEGMLDIAVVGDVFAAPGPPKLIEALRMANCQAGVLLITLNHAGDVMSSNIAMEMAKKEGLNVKMILTHEDIAPGIDAPVEDRRGLLGCVPMFKVVGAAAESGKSLDEVYAIAEKFNNSMSTLAVACKTATHPSTGQSIFAMADDEMEIGMGQHGEAGTGRSKMLTADETAELMLERLLEAVNAQKGDQLLMMISGSGATTLMEMFIIYRRAYSILSERGINVVARIGEFLTVQEMAGFQMTIAKMDDELMSLWNAPCDSPYFTVR